MKRLAQLLPWLWILGLPALIWSEHDLSIFKQYIVTSIYTRYLHPNLESFTFALGSSYLLGFASASLIDKRWRYDPMDMYHIQWSGQLTPREKGSVRTFVRLAGFLLASALPSLAFRPTGRFILSATIALSSAIYVYAHWCLNPAYSLERISPSRSRDVQQIIRLPQSFMLKEIVIFSRLFVVLPVLALFVAVYPILPPPLQLTLHVPFLTALTLFLIMCVILRFVLIYLESLLSKVRQSLS